MPEHHRSHPLRFDRPARLALLVLTGLLMTVVAGLGISAASWGADLREESRLLPGTTLAGVDVGGLAVSTAAERLGEALDTRLDARITLHADGRQWSTTPRDLGASADLEDVLQAALDRTNEASLTTLARIRFTGAVPGLGRDVSVAADPSVVAGFVAELASDLDRPARDATLTWVDDGFAVDPAQQGRALDQAAATAALIAAVADGDASVELTTRELSPEVSTARADTVAATLTPSITAALDHTVTLQLGDRAWTVTPRDLGATPDTDPLVRAALRGEAPDAVALSWPDGAVEDRLDRIAEEVAVAPRSADAVWRDGQLSVTPEQPGTALVRDGVAETLMAALRGEADRVELETRTVSPSLTRASFERYLVVDQPARTVTYYRNGEVVRQWPVAVGLAGSPTPTGLFTVGAKRYEPTWVNPSPNGWGRDMPARIGPGPDNPLGLRALNWNRDGRDTLIRFHGTPNEASIGEAASRGCVRMFNADVVELYDLVPTGTPILSVR